MTLSLAEFVWSLLLIAATVGIIGLLVWAGVILLETRLFGLLGIRERVDYIISHPSEPHFATSLVDLLAHAGQWWPAPSNRCRDLLLAIPHQPLAEGIWYDRLTYLHIERSGRVRIVRRRLWRWYW